MKWILLAALTTTAFGQILSPISMSPVSTVLAVPAFVSGRSSTGTDVNLSTQSNTGCATNHYCVSLPEPSKSNNALTLAVEYSSGTATTMTVTTDQSQTFTSAQKTTAQSSKILETFYLCGTTASTQVINIASSAAINTVQIFHVFVGQWNNVATSSCLDTSIKNNAATNTTFTAGSMTPAVTGDLLIMDGCAAGTPARTSFTAGTGQTGITWVKRGSDIIDGCMEQWGVYSSTSAINPQMTTAATSTFVATALALKAATAGTAPTGMYIAYQAACNSPAANSSATQACEFPSTGNLLVSANNCGTQHATSVTDSGNTWIKTTPANSQEAVGGGLSASLTQSFYAPNAAVDNTGAITFNQTGTGDCTYMVYDVAGAATAPLANQLSAAGTQAGTGSLTTLSSFLPGITDGLVFAASGQASNTASGFSSPSGANFQSATYGGQSLSGPSLPDQNNVWGSLHNSSASAQTWTNTWVKVQAAGDWAANALSFISGTGAFSGPSLVQVPVSCQTAANQATVACTITASAGSTALIVGTGNTGTHTVTKVCTDGGTCGAGNSFTQATSAHAVNSTNETDVWYLLSAASGKTTITVTFNVSAAYNKEAVVYEVRNITAFDLANSASTTGSSNVDTCTAITTTGSAGFAIGMISVANAIIAVPAPGNNFGYGGVIFSTTTDAASALVTAATGSVQPKFYDNTAAGAFACSTAAFK